MTSIESVQLQFRRTPWPLSHSHKTMAMTLIASVANTLDVLGEETSPGAVIRALENLPQTDRSRQIVEDAIAGLKALARTGHPG